MTARERGYVITSCGPIAPHWTVVAVVAKLVLNRWATEDEMAELLGRCPPGYRGWLEGAKSAETHS